MKNKILDIVTLDIGSTKIAGLYARLENNNQVKLLYQGLSYSEGVRSSVIIDQRNAEASIINAVYNLEKETGSSIKNVTVSLSGNGTKSYYILSKLKLSGNRITSSEVKQLIQKALTEFDSTEQEIIHYFPVEYILDKQVGIDDPIGMIGKELKCRLHIITADTSILYNIANCFAKYRIEVNNFILSSYASAYNCLTEDEKSLGCVFIEMGARTTSFCIFLNGQPIFTDYILIGSSHITNDIAKIFSISFTLAEKLKILYGNCYNDAHDKGHVIDFEELLGEYNNDLSNNLTIGDLTSIINPRVEEMFELLFEKINKLSADHLISNKIVLSGGGAMIKGLKELLSSMTSKRIRLAIDKSSFELVDNCSAPLYSTALGMLKSFSHRTQRQYEINRFDAKDGALKKFFLWLKEYI